MVELRVAALGSLVLAKKVHSPGLGIAALGDLCYFFQKIAVFLAWSKGPKIGGSAHKSLKKFLGRAVRVVLLYDLVVWDLPEFRLVSFPGRKHVYQ